MSIFITKRAWGICSASFLLMAAITSGCDDSSSSSSADAGLDGGPDSGTDDGGGSGNNDGETGEDCWGPDDCLPTLDCVDDVCQSTGCTTGLEGCACADGELCATDSNGDDLSCIDGICMSPDCSAAGETGCPCINNSECSAATDACENGFCVPADCLPGEDGCDCLAGGCDPGLFCKDGAICVDDTGYEGGSCLPDGTCHLSNFCDELLSICVHCELGSEGCQCIETTSSCDVGLSCWQGYCQAYSDLPPSDPKCFTPCNDNLNTDDKIVECDTDGLLPGCIEDLSCLEGSCVVSGEAKPVCANEIDCPFFQTCLQGGCYSNCDTNTDCHGGKECFKKVCRIPCQSTSGATACAADMFCESHDGESGFCVALHSTPTGNDEQDGGVPQEQGFTLTHEGFEFSNIKTSDTLTVVDNGQWPQDVTVRKLSHTLTKADGSTETVVAEVDEVTGELLECNAAAGECPLWWLTISQDTASTTDQQLTFKLLPNCEETETCPEVSFSDAAGVDAVKWDAVLEFIAPGAPSIRIHFFYTEIPDGQWSGSMYYYGNFSENGVAQWLGSSDTTQIDNGLLKRWLAYRDGSIAGGWHEMKAILQATETNSWKFGEVAKRCTKDASLPEGACYPYTNTMGIKPYVQDLSASPIPSGAVEYPVAFNLRSDPDDDTKLVGRIETSIGMHYSANPAIEIGFEADPAASDSCNSNVTTDCFVGLTNMFSEIVVGGQYILPIDDVCDEGYAPKETPWMIPGFQADTYVNAETGYRYRYVCRDDEVPYDASTDVTIKDINMALSEANPIPDGTQRRRSLELLDGALINQSELFILFRESFESIILYEDETELTTAYGYMILKKQPADLGDDDENANSIPDAFEGSTPPEPSDKGGDKLGLSCRQQLIDDSKVGTSGDALANLENDELKRLSLVLLKGNQVDGVWDTAWDVLESDRINNDVMVHYLCEDTGLFNGGKGDTGNDEFNTDGEPDAGLLDGGMEDGGISDVSVPCPEGSKVTFFVVKDPSVTTYADIADEPCQEVGLCQTTLNIWRNNGLIESWTPFWKCADNKDYCDEDRLDLRVGKEFYVPPPASASDKIFLPLQPEIDNAFRYKTRFKSRSGAQVGFAPEICIPNSDEIPYCYDPPTIEEIRDRVDCLVAIYTLPNYETSFEGSDEKDYLETFLRGSYSEFKIYDEAPVPEVIDTRDGFERLYSELLVMQGDEALTAAFASRFDLAGTGGATFEGSKLEAGGIDLSGVAGFEMYRLYQAVQYYQLALDRLYKSGPNMSTALDRHHPSKPGGSGTDSNANYISPETVVLYFDRLIGASTQKARAWSEIAKRYQNFNHPELARSVIERAYTSTYLEGAILSNLMWDIDAQSTTSKKAQIEKTIENGQLRYRMGMLKMQDLYRSITDDVNYFGLAPDYIPFPALESDVSSSENGFDVLLLAAQNKTSVAIQREVLAISSNRDYNTDAAAFQSELAHIRLNYEDRLSTLCGTFEGYDNEIYPAISKYSDMNDQAMFYGDPCGRMGNGTIWNSIFFYEDGLLAQKQIALEMEHALQSMEDLQTTTAEKCELADDKAELTKQFDNDILDLSATKDTISSWIKFGTKATVAGIKFVRDACCIPSPVTECKGPVGAAVMLLARGIDAYSKVELKKMEIDNKRDIQIIKDGKLKSTALLECDKFDVELRANMKKAWLGLEKFNLQAARAAHNSDLLLSELNRYTKEAKRIQAQQTETEQLAINLEAARNDPNVRIYRNDAVINADVSFEDAMRAAYRATKVFEYYTSQTYAYKDQLFLIRMVGAGEYNLENYLIDLENAFFDFEEKYGNPDLRVEVVSLRDDIMQIPFLDDDGAALSQAQRIDMMREQLGNVETLDTKGRINIPFATDLESLSPLTRNHKIRFIEADIVGSDVGDTMGRLTMKQIGTGVVHNIYDETDYYVFPERTTVIDAFFNGNRIFDPNLYQNVRLRDRPFVNTAWQLILDQREEDVNMDINLQSLSDMRIYLYYSDFTAL